MIDINKIQEVKERADIVQVAYRFNIQLDRNLKAKCPFHKEKTASFSINKNKQIFKCFGCGIGGDSITLVSKMLNINAYEAAKNINDLLGLGIDFGTKTNTYELEKFRHQQLVKEEYKKWQNKAFNILCNYYHHLRNINDYHEIDMVDYFLEVLREGTEEEKKQFYIHERKWVNELGKRGFG
ncbi:MAG: hypothetical protein J6B87_03035 [Clostridia bacterium]|nr:hypothetical protein [Clostridia bacterium]